MSLKIIKQGLFDSVQDGGRNGYRHLGINPGGPMDQYAAALANALLGKDLSHPLIELSFPASSFLFQTGTMICLAGGNFSPFINDRPIKLHQPVYVPAGSLLQFKQLADGRWCYLAVAHELQVEPWLKSFSTHTKIGVGGFMGRTLKLDDIIPFKPFPHFRNNKTEVKQVTWQAKGLDYPDTKLEVIKGPEWNWLDDDAMKLLTTSSFRIAPQSDRMGYRLEGPVLNARVSQQVLSSAVGAGTVQLLPNGQLIVLMADHQTTGGYPRIGHMAATSLPLLVQQQTGKSISFKIMDAATAEQALVSREQSLVKLRMACSFNMQNYLDASM
jgi:antagonist of KipI